MANGDWMEVVGFQFRCGKLNILFFNQTAFWCLSQKEERKHLELPSKGISVSQKSFPNGDMQVFLCVHLHQFSNTACVP